MALSDNLFLILVILFSVIEKILSFSVEVFTVSNALQIASKLGMRFPVDSYN